jgi:cytochrome c553
MNAEKILNMLRSHIGTQLAGILFVVMAGVITATRAESADAPVSDTIAERVRACTVCHGKEGRATSEGYYPRIAGKPAGYLYNQLVNFREGRRRNAMMTYLVSNLPDAFLHEIAAHFSSQNPPHAPPAVAPVAADVMERGRQLAMQGAKTRDIPACSACHGDALMGVAPSVPGLLGLSRDYINSQFGAWRIGARHAAAPDCMAELTRRLSADDVSAVAAYLSSRVMPANAVPASALPANPPLECGSLAITKRSP